MHIQPAFKKCKSVSNANVDQSYKILGKVRPKGGAKVSKVRSIKPLLSQFSKL